MRKIVALVVLALGVTASVQAQLAVVCPTCSNLWTQAAGYAMQGDSLAKQALQFDILPSLKEGDSYGATR